MTDGASAEVMAAYAAGLFDGEGCVMVIGKRRHLSVTLGNTDLKVLEWLQTHFGGKIMRRHKVITKHRQFYTWYINRPKLTRKFLETIQPYTIIKNPQITVALAFIEVKRRQELVLDHSRWVISDEDHALERTLDEMLRMLKRQ